MEIQPEDVLRDESKIVKTVRKANTVRYLTQAVFGMVVLIFSAVQVSINKGQDNSIWIGLICTIIGVFFPHPTPYTEDITGAVAGVAGGGGIGGGDVIATTHTRSRPAATRTIVTTTRSPALGSRQLPELIE